MTHSIQHQVREWCKKCILLLQSHYKWTVVSTRDFLRNSVFLEFSSSLHDHMITRLISTICQLLINSQDVLSSSFLCAVILRTIFNLCTLYRSCTLRTYSKQTANWITVRITLSTRITQFIKLKLFIFNIMQQNISLTQIIITLYLNYFISVN